MCMYAQWRISAQLPNTRKSEFTKHTRNASRFLIILVVLIAVGCSAAAAAAPTCIEAKAYTKTDTLHR